MLGQKTQITLQKRTETYSEGTPTVTYTDICSFDAVFTAVTGIEIQRYDKETVNKMYKLGFDYDAPGDNNISEVKERNRIRIGKRKFDIEWCHNPGNVNRYWILHIREFDEAIT